MKQSLQAARVGIFFVLGLILIYAVFSVIGNRSFRQEEGYQLDATFNDVKTLTAGTDVRMAGVRIGSVGDIGLIDGRARTLLRIQSSVEIPADSIATIGTASLLGQNYIDIEYGSSSAPRLQAGDTIEVRETADFNQIMNQIGDLGAKFSEVADSFSGFGGGDMGSLFENLNALVTENRQQVDSIVRNVEQITTRLREGEGTLGKLLAEDGAYDELMAMVAEINGAASDARRLITEAEGIVTDVKSGRGTVGQLLYDDQLAQELNATVANIRSFSDKLNSGEGTLGRLVTDDSLYRELQAMMQKAEQALDSVGDSGPISAVGTAAGALF